MMRDDHTWISDREKAVTKPSSRSAIPANVGESAVLVAVWSAEGYLLDRLVDEKSLWLDVNHSQSVSSYMKSGSNLRGRQDGKNSSKKFVVFEYLLKLIKTVTTKNSPLCARICIWISSSLRHLRTLAFLLIQKPAQKDCHGWIIRRPYCDTAWTIFYQRVPASGLPHLNTA